MNLLLRLAWRNTWRNRRRTAILICAMMAGLVGVLVSLGLTNSWLDQFRHNTVRFYHGHLKAHRRGYQDNPIIENSFPPLAELTARLAGDDRIRGWADRVAVSALLQTPRRSIVVSLVGVDPAREPAVSDVPRSVIAGEYLDLPETGVPPLLMGRQLAEKLGLGVGRKVVALSPQYGSGEVGAAAFRIRGIYDTGTGGFDDQYVFVRRADLQAMLNLGERVTETVILLREDRDGAGLARDLGRVAADAAVEVLTWRERLPFVARTIELSNQMMMPYYAIFYLAMAFGIVNTLVMAVGERTHEIGVMMAVGMPRRTVVGMILLESAMIAAVAIGLGSLLGCMIVRWLGRVGIDLSVMVEGLSYPGLGRVLYPRLEPGGVALAALVALAVAAVFSLYPAVRAARLAPVEALRQVA